MAIYFKNGIEISDADIEAMKKVRQFRRMQERRFGENPETDEEMLLVLYKEALSVYIDKGAREYAMRCTGTTGMPEEYEEPSIN